MLILQGTDAALAGQFEQEGGAGQGRWLADKKWEYSNS